MPIGPGSVVATMPVGPISVGFPPASIRYPLTLLLPVFET